MMMVMMTTAMVMMITAMVMLMQFVSHRPDKASVIPMALRCRLLYIMEIS